jgi:hypothetical protein
MAAVFDSVLRERVKTASRRQSWLAAAIAILSLIVGWLLNAINPVSLASLLHH